MNRKDLARTIDHTLLRPEATAAEIDQLCDQALQYSFASVCVHPIFVPQVARRLEDSHTAVCTVIGFPFGATHRLVKTREALQALEEGATELDLVPHMPALLRADYDAVHSELLEVLSPLPGARSDATIKIIIETALLMHNVSPDIAEHRLATACRAIHEAGGDYVKTSTGFHPTGGATLQAVQLLHKHSRGLKVKASGGIRTLADAQAMLQAGATRLGTSNSVAILRELSE